MRVDDLNIKELLELGSGGGLIRFAGQRALLIDAAALGSLRNELIDKLGATVARVVLTRFGFVHGWRMAESMRDQFKWETAEEWAHAGVRIQMLEGMFRLDPANPDPLSKAGATLFESYEACLLYTSIPMVPDECLMVILHFLKSNKPVDRPCGRRAIS